MQGPNSEPSLGNYPAFPHNTPPPHHQIKPYYISETKVFLRRYLEIYRHLLSRCFKNAVLEGQEMVQCNIFFDTKQKHDCWKICEVRNIFGCVEGVMSSELRFVKWVTLFERNCIVKCVIIFANFCWLWDFLLENLKIKKKTLMKSTGTSGKIWKCYIPKIFSKIEFLIWDFESFIFWSKFRFLGGCFRVF